MTVAVGTPASLPATSSAVATTTRYVIVDESGDMTCATTAPAAMLRPTGSVPSEWRKFVRALCDFGLPALGLWLVSVAGLAAMLCVCLHRALWQRQRLELLVAMTTRASAVSESAPAEKPG